MQMQRETADAALIQLCSVGQRAVISVLCQQAVLRQHRNGMRQ